MFLAITSFKKQFPIIYKNNQNSCVSKDIIKDWFFNNFTKQARKQCNNVGLKSDCKIFLLLDNCAAHPNESVLQSDNIVAHFLPLPLSKHSFKSHYKTEFLKKILEIDPSLKLQDYKKQFNLMDYVNLLSESWNSDSQSTLVNAWHNIWPNSLFIESVSNAKEFEGFQTDPIKEKANELFLLSKEATKNEHIFEEESIMNWMCNVHELKHEY